MLPAPVDGSMPLWIGGVGEQRTLRITARHATGWNAAYISPDEFRRLNGVLDRHCEDIGRDPAEIERSLNLMFNLGVDEAAAAQAEADLVAQWGPMWDRVSAGALLGTPDSAVERLLAYRDAGADLVNIAIRAPIDHAALAAYLTETVPAVRAATA